MSGHKEAIPVTHLRNMMLEELERRNYSQSTARPYLMTKIELKASTNLLGDSQIAVYPLATIEGSSRSRR
jgi:hypothetical protein